MPDAESVVIGIMGVYAAAGIAMTLYRIGIRLAPWVRWWGRVYHELRQPQRTA